jgi:glycosyltransferase involved in cell wall biosynthesis
MTRICSYPASGGTNHYLDLYYRALEPHGFARSRPLVYRDQFLRDHRDEFDLLHVQWLHERLWRRHGWGPLARGRDLVGFWRFLRTAKRLGKRIVWTVHDLEPHDGVGLADRAGTAMLARAADLVICHTAATRERLVRRYLGRRDTTVIMRHGNYDGVFPAPRPRAETAAAFGFDPSARTLVAAGNLRGYKGFEVAVEAATLLGPEYQLVIAGGHNPETPEVADALRKQVAGRANVRLVVRQVGDDELADLYAAADCVLLPYRWITGSGALITSLTLGRAVVASDLPFFRNELADEPAAGVLVPPGDPAALAAGVKEFFASGVPARHAAARRLADRLAWPEVVKPVVARLRELFPAPAVEEAR